MNCRLQKKIGSDCGATGPEAFDICLCDVSGRILTSAPGSLHTDFSGTGSVAAAYRYSYDGFGRLTAVTMGTGADQMTLAQHSYNQIGQLTSSSFGAAGATTFSYTAQGALKSISSPSFSQTLYYTDSPNPSYSGNISAMQWSNPGGLVRKYAYTYDGLNRLTSASYSEQGRTQGGTLSTVISGIPDYSCTYAYDLNSNPLTVERRGVSDIYKENVIGNINLTRIVFGTVDDLTLSYRGNKLIKATDRADETIYTQATDFNDGADLTNEYVYDHNGNMTADANRCIESIEYNWLNLPVKVTFDDGVTLTAYYDAEGTLLRRHVYGTVQPGILSPLPPYSISQQEDRYCDFVYTGGVLTRIDTPTGYLAGDSLYHYVHDYQGNVRQVVRNDGTPVQTSHYYPYGMLMGESTDIIAANTQTPQLPSSSAARNRRLYGGKELITAQGLNLYDFGARLQDPSLMIFTTPDPLAWDYPSLSQYAYCAGNPVMLIDPSGKDIWEINKKGEVSWVEESDNDTFYILDEKGIRDENLKLSFEKGTLITKETWHYNSVVNLKDKKGNIIKVEIDNIDIFQVRGDENGKSLFEFLADNTVVEWSFIETGIEGSKGLNFLSSGHSNLCEPGATALINDQLINGYTVRSFTHNHPSGDSEVTSDSSDAKFRNNVGKLFRDYKPSFYIYTSKGNYNQY